MSHAATDGEQQQEGGTQRIFKPDKIGVLLLGYPFKFGTEPWFRVRIKVRSGRTTSSEPQEMCQAAMLKGKSRIRSPSHCFRSVEPWLGGVCTNSLSTFREDYFPQGLCLLLLGASPRQSVGQGCPPGTLNYECQSSPASANTAR